MINARKHPSDAAPCAEYTRLILRWITGNPINKVTRNARMSLGGRRKQVGVTFVQVSITKLPWRKFEIFVKVYKAKTLAPESPDLDSESLIQDSMLNKLCPPFCLYLPYSSLESLMREDRLSPSPYGWMYDPFSL